jgi:uncharacterized protein YggU (UPF0235/DUF167 family)
LTGRAGSSAAWSIGPDGLRLCVRLTPKSSRDSLDGTELLPDGRVVLKARVRAVPEAGKANEALARLVAKALDVAAAKITLESGASGRIKILRIAGDGEALALRLAALTAAAKR